MAAANENSNPDHSDHAAPGAADGGHDCCCHQDHSAELAHHHVDDAICIDHVSFRYNGTGVETEPALEAITMHVPVGTRLGVVGPNGGGKTTLLKLMLGLQRPTTGSVEVFHETPREACRRNWIGYVPQRHEGEMAFPLSVRQVVHQGLAGRAGLLRRLSRDDRDQAELALERVDMLDHANQPIGDLSGGQQQRAFIARALAPQPRILVLDEPMVGVDELGKRRFAELIETIRSTYELTLVIVSHDLAAIIAGCDRIACLNRRLHFHDTPDGLTREVIDEVFSHSLEGTLRA